MKYSKASKYLHINVNQLGIEIIEEDFELINENEYRIHLHLPLNQGFILTKNAKKQINEIFVYGLEEDFGEINKNNIDEAVNKLNNFYKTCLQIKYFDFFNQEQGMYIFQSEEQPEFKDIETIWENNISKVLKYETFDGDSIVLKDYTSISVIEVTHKLNGISESFKVEGKHIKK